MICEGRHAATGRETGEQDLFRSRLDQIIDMKHPLVRLARTVDWGFLEGRFGEVYTDDPGHPPLPTRLMAGLAILKHTYDLSDEVLCERWVENPYYQYFCGEEFFQHRLVFDRSSLTRWRNRMGRSGWRSATGWLCVSPIRGWASSLWSSTSVMPTPSSSSAPTGCSRSCAPYSAVSSATSIARSRATAGAKGRSHSCYCWRGACASRSNISAAGRSIPCMRRKSNASARAKLIGLTSSASKSPSQPRSAMPRAASSSPM